MQYLWTSLSLFGYWSTVRLAKSITMPGILSHTGLLGGKISGKALQTGVCITAASGFLLFGYDQGIMSGIITEPIFLAQFPQMEPSNKSGAIQALVVAIYEIGCLLGSGLIIFVGDKLGRRKSVLIGTLIMLIGTALQATAFTLGHLIVGRIVTGFGNGMNTSSIPVWQSEMAPPKIRGFLVLFEGCVSRRSQDVHNAFADFTRTEP